MRKTLAGGTITLALSLSLALAGCGDDGGGGGGGIGGGIPGNTPISDLTDAQAADLCADVANAVEDELGNIVELNCTIAGIFAAALGGGGVSECEAAADACIDDPPADAGDDPIECDLGSSADRAGCDVTVAEATACVEDQIDTFGDVASTLTCDLLSDPENPPVIEEPDLPASCEGLDTRCPDLFGDDD